MNLSPQSFFRCFLPAVLAALFLACARASADDDTARNLKDGFYLFHDVCHEETQVHLITLIKTTPADVNDYVERISKTADRDLKEIDRMEDEDSALKLDKNPLPAFEIKVRASIRSDKQHQLLFGTSGPSFARALLVTQIEATNYLDNMAKVLADEDPNAHRTRELEKISAHWEALRVQGFKLLDAR